MPQPFFNAEFVYVPVPRDRVLEIMQILASAPRDSMPSRRIAKEVAPQPTAASPAEPADDAADEAAELSSEWQPHELRELVELCPAKQLLVLQLLAQRAGTWVTAGDLREYLVEHRDISEINTERSGRALGAVMAALRKRSAWYDHKPPFAWEWNETRWENLYCMPPEHMDTILAALREHRPDEMGATD